MNIAVLCSGNGTNLQAIINSIKRGYIKKTRIALVISDNPNAYALKRAHRAGIKTLVFLPKDFKTRLDYDKAIIKILRQLNVELIVLAGFMRVLTAFFVKSFKYGILNIHPALLPAFPGTDGIGDTLRYGAKVGGVTVHFVDEGVDTGPIIVQKALDIKDNDSKDNLASRIHKIEHKIYPLAIKLFVENRLKIVGRKVKILKT